MDIIKPCTELPNIRARALLRTRVLNEHQLNHFMVMACAHLTRSYIMLRQEQCVIGPGETDINTLLHKVNIQVLAARVNLDAAFTTLVVRELAADVIAQLRTTL